MITSMMESSNPLNFISNLLGKKKMTILHYIKETAKYFHFPHGTTREKFYSFRYNFKK